MANHTGDRLSPERRALLEQRLRGKATEARVLLAIPPRQSSGPAPATFMQRRVWFVEQLTQGSPAYHLPAVRRFQGPLDVAAFGRAIGEILRRHESLRTTFAPGPDGEPVQIIHPPAPYDLTVREAASAEEARRQIEETVQRPFDLEQGPLFRALLLRLAPDDHIAVFCLHHIISDGWSLSVFARELMALYAAFAAGQASPLADLPVQYADYAAWHRQRLSALAAQLDWWKAKLAGPLPVLELPADRPRPPVQTYRGASETLLLPHALLDQLKAFSREQGASLFMTLLAGFNTLLHRYSGQTDLLVGTPVANRSEEETEGLIGFFANTLVLRTDLGGAPSFREVLARVRQEALAVFGRPDLPLEMLVEALKLPRNMSHSPIFQVVLAMLNTPVERFHLPSLVTTPVSFGLGGAKFDLWLAAMERPEGLQLDLEYATDLFDAATARRLLGHLQRLLEMAMAQPDQSITSLPLLTEAEERLLLVEWNDTAAAYPADVQPCIHRLIEAQARRTPGAPALTVGGRTLSYAELNGRANRLARRLRALGVGPGHIVAICMERSEWMVVGLLAILKAGGAYLPMDPAYPRDRLAYMLADSGAALVLTAPGVHLPNGATPVYVDDDPAADAADLEGGATPHDLAYVIYTSGSTGKPKGVMLEHRGVANFLLAMARTPGLTAADTLAAVTSISFDIAGLELWLPLTVGARIALADRETAADGRKLAALLHESGATVLQATPATWRLLEEAGWRSDGSLTMLVGGEALPPDLAQRLAASGPLWNMYGPTETTIWSSCCRVVPGEPVTIGRPIANTAIYLLDASLQPVPSGHPGELYIGGDGLARGYLHRPDLTAERFINTVYGRVYRTGDLARYLPDGRLDFLGRVDHQVKIRGFRIELGEIEAVLLRHPAVRQAVVVAREDLPGEKRLVAYLVPAAAGDAASASAGAQPLAGDAPSPANGAPSPAELRAFLKQDLPDYMLPAAFVALDRFPLTPNGKVDRKALPAPEEGARLETDQPFVPPRTAAEQAVAAVWAEVLRQERVSVHDHFFEAGGHSLLGIRLLAKLRESLGVELPLQTLFEAPTVEGLAAAIAVAAPATGAAVARLPELEPDPAHAAEPFPQTYVQQAYLTGRSGYFDLSACGTNFFTEFAVTGATEAFLLRFNRALQRLIARHAILRLVMLPDGQARILPEVPPYEVALCDPGALEQRRRSLQFDKHPVDRWPLFDFEAYPLEGELRILARIDATILDGTSRLILLKELFQLLEEPAAELPPLSLTYREYALGLAAVQETELFRRSREYWLAKAPTLPGPPEFPLTAPIGPETETHNISPTARLLDAPAWQKLKSRAARAALTPSGLVIAALAEVLGAFSATPCFTLSLVASYRLPMHPDIHTMVGNFNSISLLAVEMGEGTFLERAKRLQAQLSADLEHMYYPGFLVLRELARLRGDGVKSHSPVLINSLIEYSHGAYQSRQLDRGSVATPDGTIRITGGHFTIPQILLEPILMETGDGSLGAQWLAVGHLFPPGLVDAMLAAFGRLLQALAADDSVWQRRSVVDRWPGDGAPAPAAAVSAEPAVASSAAEQRLADLAAAILERPAVAPGDNLFHLGATSLDILRLAAAVEEAFGCKLPLGALAGGATVRHLARSLSATRRPG